MLPNQERLPCNCGERDTHADGSGSPKVTAFPQYASKRPARPLRGRSRSPSEGVLNAPLQLRLMWADIRSRVNLPKEQIEAFDRQLTLDDVLRESVTGELIGKVVTKFLLEHNSRLKTNGRSDYPDVYLSDLDYPGLKAFRRTSGGDKHEYGAALKNSRPVRVPDGLEIKTCQKTIRVDCHYPHIGLHLCLVYGEIDRAFTVTDLRIAFLRTSDYHISGRNTEATTAKASFNGDRFVSLFPQA